jgi:Fe-S-cluster containining protein
MADRSDNASASEVRINFSLPMRGGSLQASAMAPAGRATLTQLLPILQNLDNAIIGRITQEAQMAGSPISCGPHCGACCRQMVPLSFFEAEALTEWIGTLPEERRVELQGRFHRALTALRDAGVIDKILGDKWGGETLVSTELAMEYFRARVPCPFLENESCSIHPIRPLVCREYLVTSPAALCEDPGIHDLAAVQLPVKLSSALYAFGQQMEEDHRGWIPLVFLLAWGRSGARPGEYVAGTSEEVMKRFLAQLENQPPDKAEAAESAASV